MRLFCPSEVPCPVEVEQVVGAGHHLAPPPPPTCLEAPAWRSARPRGLEKGQPTGGAACTPRVQGPLLCLQIHSPQHVLHILIKVPPWLAGPLMDGARPSCGVAVV